MMSEYSFQDSQETDCCPESQSSQSTTSEPQILEASIDYDEDDLPNDFELHSRLSSEPLQELVESIRTKLWNYQIQFDELSPETFHRFEHLDPWVEDVISYCTNLVTNHEEPEVIEPLMDFLAQLFSDQAAVQLAFESDLALQLCSIFRKVLSDEGDLPINALKVLISMLKTLENFKLQDDLESEIAEKSPRRVAFDNIPLLLVQTEVHRYAFACLSASDVTVFNAALEFSLHFGSFGDFSFLKVIPMLETIFGCFNLFHDNPKFDKEMTAQFVELVVVNLDRDDVLLDDINTFQKQIMEFVSTVISSRFWKAKSKLNCIKLLQVCSKLLQKDDCYAWWPFSEFLHFIHSTVADLDCLQVLSFLLKSDFKSPVLRVPEFETESTVRNQLLTLLTNLCFTLFNLLIKRMDPNQEVYIWETLSEVLSFACRKLSSEDCSTSDVELAKALMLNSSVTTAMQDMVFRLIDPETQPDLNMLLFLRNWIKTLDLLATTPPPDKLRMFSGSYGSTLMSIAIQSLVQDMRQWAGEHLHHVDDEDFLYDTQSTDASADDDNDNETDCSLFTADDSYETRKRKYLKEIRFFAKKCLDALTTVRGDLIESPELIWSDDE